MSEKSKTELEVITGQEDSKKMTDAEEMDKLFVEIWKIFEKYKLTPSQVLGVLETIKFEIHDRLMAVEEKEMEEALEKATK